MFTLTMGLNILLCLFNTWLLLILSVNRISSQEIANQKCEEYSQIMQNKSCSMSINPLIVGGATAREKEFPHMVALAFINRDSLTWKCGGTLISHQHVLTAAHCCRSRFGHPKVARMGSINLPNPTKYTQDRLVLDVQVHPNFTETTKYNDIAILLLNKPVEFSPFVRPACLHTERGVTVKEAEVIGFGKQHRVADHHHSHNPPLQKVFVDIIERDLCNENMLETKELPQNVTESLICAGLLETGGKDACQGDSGGPLQVPARNVYCNFMVIGVVSAGNQCAMAYDPGLYTNVGYFIQWIESVVWSYNNTENSL